MPAVCSDREKGQTDETLQDDNVDFQGIELAATEFGQNPGDRLAEGSGVGATHNPCFVLTRETNKIPIGLFILRLKV